MEPTPNGENTDIFYLLNFDHWLTPKLSVSQRTIHRKKITAFYENAYPNAPFSILSDVEFAVCLSGCCGLFPFFAIPCQMTLLSPHFPFHYPLSTGFFRFLNFPDMIPLPTFQFGALLPSREPSAWTLHVVLR